MHLGELDLHARENTLRFRSMSRLLRPLPLICLAMLVVGLYRCHSGSDIEHGPGVLVADNPLQTELEGARHIELHGFRLMPRAEFRATVRVLRREDYSLGALANLVPTDFAVGWGPMSDSSVLSGIRISQGNRFYYWRTEYWPIPRRDIEIHSANWHVIAVDDRVRAALDALRAGSVVELSGRLVDIDGPEASMRTSLTRLDTGAGACEILLASAVRIVESGG
jgi:hypothetical protein